MIPADVDPTLCAAEPAVEKLTDGFSPPAADEEESAGDGAKPTPQQALGAKSPY